MFFPELTNTK
jgi:Xaa-Pro aminopeptidase